MTESSATEAAAHRWFGRPAQALGQVERAVLSATRSRNVISRNLEDSFAGRLSFGQRLADRVAEFGGSWTFIIGFGVVLALWAGLNALVLARPFDPYPFIFLNLMLSMLAAVQAPIIMMSQNRQAARDRLDAAHDYEVNLKAEIEIMALHDKLDRMRAEQIEALLVRQQEQIDLLTRLLQERRPPG
ncbi:DUF1003 domain-containing protein [Paracraurococcus lichenis]|uniref:DUF1003 domain-containing protein n=1 Tax=Paracraurococcus lichenis TaxID=3064888 RepID=A0ABT9DUL8_9PROT|nr:DUF1003 domain-containing protein [Paracraurococcus sp. LOR1-02]MDO9707490.1 DUF1003 domain-containing protein [Paracraurococcus sp. LOR1-02]